MHKQAKDILKLVQILTNNTEKEFRHEYLEHYICLEDNPNIHIDCSKWNNEIRGILNWLIDAKYLAPGQTSDCYALTQKGVHPYAVKWEEIKHFLFTSIFIPIVVSVATTLITIFINGLIN